MLHLIPHGYDIVPVIRVATELQIPYCITIHDDIEYTSLGHPFIKQMVSATAHAWRGAAAVFTICDAMGNEYVRRFGQRDFITVTDGLKEIAAAPQLRPNNQLRIYFMGLFHIRYGVNLRALLDALKILRLLHPEWSISVVCRSGGVSCNRTADDVPLTVLPFASEADVARDMESADILYQPLPFQDDSQAFGKFSLSTKLVTYLGSGLPVLYHGPRSTAASALLAEHDAAVLATTLDPSAIARQLMDTVARRDTIVRNALALARSQFLLVDQQRRFWQTIAAVTEPISPPLDNHMPLP